MSTGRQIRIRGGGLPARPSGRPRPASVRTVTPPAACPGVSGSTAPSVVVRPHGDEVSTASTVRGAASAGRTRPGCASPSARKGVLSDLGKPRERRHEPVAAGRPARAAYLGGDDGSRPRDAPTCSARRASVTCWIHGVPAPGARPAGCRPGRRAPRGARRSRPDARPVSSGTPPGSGGGGCGRRRRAGRAVPSRRRPRRPTAHPGGIRPARRAVRPSGIPDLVVGLHVRCGEQGVRVACHGKVSNAPPVLPGAPSAG